MWSAVAAGEAAPSPAAALASMRAALVHLVALLHAEARGLLNGADPHALELYGVGALHGWLAGTLRAHPRAGKRRSGAWGRVQRALSAFARSAGRGGASAALPPVPELPAALDDHTAYRVLDQLLRFRGRSVDYGTIEIETLGALLETLLGQRLEPDGSRRGWGISPSDARRTSGSHYTPRELTEPIVAGALAPVLGAMGPRPTAAELLAVRVCDPAMGSGAFLLAAGRQLAGEVLDAWERQGELAAIERERGDPPMLARRLVAERCLYGVDRDPEAVRLARISLWLAVGDRRLPLERLSRRLRHGDSLVGVSPAQIEAFDPSPTPSGPSLLPELGPALRRTAALRVAACSAMANGSSRSDWPAGGSERRQLEGILERARWVGDLLVGACFDHPRARDRSAELRRRRRAIARWLHGGSEPGQELRRMRARMRAQTPVFHWALELPEVYGRGGARAGSRAGMDVVIGNPPFLGGKRIRTEHGDRYATWLGQLHRCSKNTDLAAHFFRRAASLVAADATIGFVATNTVAQGATRREGLAQLLGAPGYRIYRAHRSLPWPGDAAVSVAVVHLCKGRFDAAAEGAPTLDGRSVSFINSALRALPERAEAAALSGSTKLCFIGCFLRGAGFIVSAEERRRLLANGDHSRACLRPYLGGDEVNSSPRHAHHRYVIDFADRSLEQAQAWPDLLAIVRARVKPVRDRLRDAGVDRGHRQRWWQFANVRPELRAAIAPLRRCLVAPRVSKHLCFAFQPTNRIFSDQLCVFALSDYARFAVLQSRIHEAWARLHSSTFGEGLRYTPSVCVETFPFPDAAALAPDGPIQAAGRRLYLARARFMREVGLGMTTTYNLLADPRCRGQALAGLRRLHERLDRVVLDGYGWRNLAVPPYQRGPARTAQERGEEFEEQVIRRLYELNGRLGTSMD
ncbi:MAG: hypothetical protein JRI23_30655 [Deltaproteobacteria bacterium]|jgi:hypothetical protein|nr:hypothetical protein [Deltaproteobacteria bacterium]MBW2536547.1 hypothetical protein [Deltaproteobacteria bacterium]